MTTFICLIFECGSACSLSASPIWSSTSSVDEWIVYLMTEGQDETLEAYGAEIIPAVNS